MPQAVRGFVARLRGFWDAFTVPQRTFALIAAAAVVLGGVMFYQSVTRPSMTALYSGLSATDAQAVVDTLTAQGVTYELTGGGGTVLVPRDQLYDLRVELASQNIPSQQDGYSLLDDMGMASSDFQQQITYQRALEGELARTIRAMDGISNASVHLALPERSVFTDEVADPTASVFLAVGAGTTLDSSAVQAIQTLVAAGVADMAASDVTVIDSTGKDLSMTVNGIGGVSTDYEQRATRNVQAMLDQVLGAGNSVVTVRAEMSGDSVERISETFGATEDVPPLSSSLTTEEYTGAQSNATGVLGPDNIAVPGGQGNGSGTYERSEEVLNNSVDKVTESVMTSPGGLARQSVSVVVDTEAARAIGDDQLRDLVAAAAGVVEDRGDVLAVARTEFDRSVAQQAQEALAQAEAEEAEQEADARRSETIQTVAIAVGVLLALLFLVGLYVVRRRARERAEEDAESEAFFEDLQPFPLDEQAAAPNEAPTSVMEALEPDPDEVMRTELAELADEEPAVVAERLRDWLTVSR